MNIRTSALIALTAAILFTGCDLQPERTVWKQLTYEEAAKEGFANPWDFVGLFGDQGGCTDSKGNWYNYPRGNPGDCKVWYPPPSSCKEVTIKKGRGGHGGSWGGLTIGEWSKETEENE